MIFTPDVPISQFERLDPRLQALLLWFDRHSALHYGHDITVTSLIRPRTTDSGVHEAGRGADVRSHDFSGVELAQLTAFINKSFPYPRGLKTMIVHDTGKGVHIHLQVPWEGEIVV